ncbi:MAG TPA: L-2-hydroxyglutarate oxidase [Actinomycetota bacterium]|nr:L-2-hydroxyglutarate oxidase [Actinomycetota bacterium]
MTGAFDVVVIGGGLVGLSTAYRLLEMRPRTRVAVVEKERQVAVHQSGRNSGVVHAGIYYRPGSWRALLCREGRSALEAFARRHDIPFARPGKLIVAAEEKELPALAELHRRGVRNGLAGLRELGPSEIREREPDVTGIRALYVPETGVVDFPAVARALAREVQQRAGEVLLGHRVRRIAGLRTGQIVVTEAGEVAARVVVACAGLQSDRLAEMTGTRGGLRIVPFRGSYHRRHPAAGWNVRGLVYPVPDPRFPFLGVHFTRRGSEVWMGPNAVLALGREAYARSRVGVRDVAETLAYPGFLRLVARHVPVAVGELVRDRSPAMFARACRRYIPAVEAVDLLPGPSGIRAQAVDGRGRLVDDFVLQETDRIIHVRNAPSPAATASLAIGRVLAERAALRLDE